MPLSSFPFDVISFSRSGFALGMKTRSIFFLRPFCAICLNSSSCLRVSSFFLEYAKSTSLSECVSPVTCDPKRISNVISNFFASCFNVVFMFGVYQNKRSCVNYAFELA